MDPKGHTNFLRGSQNRFPESGTQHHVSGVRLKKAMLTDCVLSQPISFEIVTTVSGITVLQAYKVAHPQNNPVAHCFFSGL